MTIFASLEDVVDHACYSFAAFSVSFACFLLLLFLLFLCSCLLPGVFTCPLHVLVTIPVQTLRLPFLLPLFSSVCYLFLLSRHPGFICDF